MSLYLLRRIGTSLVVVLGVSIFIFFLLHAIYPSPAIDVLGPRANRASIAAWNRQNGFDNPWLVQYLHYMKALLSGSFGWSYKENQSVAALFGEVWARSAYLSGISLLFAVVIAIPLGIYQAVRRNTLGDYVATSLAFVTYAMPVYLLGLILIDVFALQLHMFSFEASQSTSLWGVMTDWYAMTLPIATLTLITVAAFSRYMRSSAIDALAQDYIKAARAKGLPERLVLFRHLLPNALGVMIVNVTFNVADAILAVAALGFLGFGLHYPNQDWGDMLSNGIQYLQDGYWWLVFPVGACIVLVVMACNLVGDGLRDSLDVRLRRR